MDKISTDVLFVRFLQEEWLERSRRLLHQSVDDFVQVGARNLEEKIETTLLVILKGNDPFYEHTHRVFHVNDVTALVPLGHAVMSEH